MEHNYVNIIISLKSNSYSLLLHALVKVITDYYLFLHVLHTAILS